MTISTLSWANTQGASSQQKSRKTEATEQHALLAAQLQQLANASQTSSSDGSTPIPAIEVAGSSRSGLSALLGSSAASGPPPPPPGGESASEFMDNLGSLLSALSSGDTEAASNAADALQSLIDGLSGTGKTQGEQASGTAGASGFISDVKSLLDAVDSGDEQAITTAAGNLAEGMNRAMGAGAPMGPPPPPPAGSEESQSVMDGLGDLLSALESGDTEATSDAATALQKVLDDLKAASGETSETGASEGRSGFLTDVQSLLDAVKSGDSASVAGASQTLSDGLSRAAQGRPPMGPPPPNGGPPPSGVTDSGSTTSKTTAESSLESVLATLTDLVGAASKESSEGSSQVAFLDSLKNLFEAMQTGTDVSDRLNAVITAYAENGAAADA